jgi:hypothetical protein
MRNALVNQLHFRLAHQAYRPDKIIITLHPQPWTDNPYQWLKELALQNLKNQVKKILIKRK